VSILRPATRAATTFKTKARTTSRPSDRKGRFAAWAAAVVFGAALAAPALAGIAPLPKPPSPFRAIALATQDSGADRAAAATEKRIVRYRIAPGDTLSALVRAAGGAPAETEAALAALRSRFDPRRLRAGQRLTVVFAPAGSEARTRLAALNLSVERDRFVVAYRKGDRFIATEASTPFDGTAGIAPARIEDAPHLTVRLRKGETLISAVVRAGGDRREALRASAAFERLYNLRRLKVGQEVTVAFEPRPKGNGKRLAAVSLALGSNRYLVAARRSSGGFRATRARAPLIPAVIAPSTSTSASTATAPTETATPSGAASNAPPAKAQTPAPAEAGAPEKTTAEKAESPRSAAATPRPVETAALAPRAVAKRVSEPASAETPPADGTRVPSEKKTLRARKGDTLSLMLRRAGASRRDAEAAVVAIGRAFDLRRLQIDQEVTVAFAPVDGVASRPRLAAVSLALGRDRYLVAGRKNDGRFVTEEADQPLLAALFPPPKPIAFAPPPARMIERELRIGKGDTLMDALRRAGSNPVEASAAVEAMRPLFDPRRLQTGQRLTVAFAPGKEADGTPARPESLFSLSLALEPGRSIEARRTESGGFAARAVAVPLAREVVHAGGRIDSSLYQAANAAGVPQAALMEFIRAFSFDVDFQRDIQRGDSFDILYERYLDDAGTPVRAGNVLYGALTLSGERIEIYRYAPPNGKVDYFDASGQSVRKALLRTPINGARLSSRYGKRKHPILGYTRIHRGVDFAAPRGTPIFAAGDGVVERAGWFSTYGRYVRIRHRGGYATAYAHMNRIAKGIRPGKRVKQGQVIGYVGSTGRSTGPHLHYEVLRAGRQINPLKVRMPSGIKLKGDALAAFQAERQRIERVLASLPLTHIVAEGPASPATDAPIPDTPAPDTRKATAAPAAGCRDAANVLFTRGRRGEAPDGAC